MEKLHSFYLLLLVLPLTSWSKFVTIHPFHYQLYKNGYRSLIENLLAICGLGGSSEVGKAGHGAQPVGIGFSLSEPITEPVDDLLKRGSGHIGKVFSRSSSQTCSTGFNLGL